MKNEKLDFVSANFWVEKLGELVGISRNFRPMRGNVETTYHQSRWHALIAVLSGSSLSGYSWVGCVWEILGCSEEFEKI